MKEIGKFFKSFTPVAEAIFLAPGHLGKGSFVIFGNEHRVVSKPCFPSRYPADTTFCVAEKSLNPSVRKRNGNATDELGAPFIVRNILEFGKKLLVIFYVVPAGAAGVPGGIDPGRAVQSIDFESRVVRKSGFTGALADLDCFLDRILLEGVPVLHCFGAIRKIVEGKDG